MEDKPVSFIDYGGEKVSIILISDITPDTINDILSLITYIFLIEGFTPYFPRISNNSKSKELKLKYEKNKADIVLSVFATENLAKILHTLSVYFLITVSGNQIIIKNRFETPVIIFSDDGQALINPKIVNYIETDTVAYQNLILIINVYNRFAFAEIIGRRTQNPTKIRFINNALSELSNLQRNKIIEMKRQVTKKNEKIIITPASNLKKIIYDVLDNNTTNTSYTDFINEYEEGEFINLLSQLNDKQKYVLWQFIITNTVIERQDTNRLLNRIERSLENNRIIRNERDLFELREIPEDELLLGDNIVELGDDVNEVLGLRRNQVVAEFATEVLNSYDRLIVIANNNLEAVRNNQEEISIEEELENEDIAPNPVFDPLEAEEAMLEYTNRENVAIFAAILETAKGDFPGLNDIGSNIFNGVQDGINSIINNAPDIINNSNLNELGAAFGAFDPRNYLIALGILGLVFSSVFSYYYWEYNKTPEVITNNEITDIISDTSINPVVDPHYISKDEDYISRQVAQAKIAYMMNWSIERFGKLWDSVPQVLLYLPEGTGSWVKWFTILCITTLTTYGLAVNPYLTIAPSFTSVALTTVGTAVVVEGVGELLFDHEGNVTKILRGTGDALSTVASGATTVLTSGAAGIGVLGALTGLAILGVAGYVIYRGIYKGEARSNVVVKQRQVFN